MEITKREIIASVTIIAIWICIGFLISGRITDHEQDVNAEYDRAARITDPDLFSHGMATNLGDAFVYGELAAEDPVTYPEIGGAYSYIRKVEEHYTRHTRTVTKTRTNAQGKTETYQETEVYWSWDEVDREKRESKSFAFLGTVFPADKFRIPSLSYLDTIKESSRVRYVYYGTPAKMTGTVYAHLENGTIGDRSEFYKDKTMDETADLLESGGGVVAFWIIWIAILCALVYGFYYLDNRWLNK